MTTQESALQAAGEAFERSRTHGATPAEAMSDAISSLQRQRALRSKGKRYQQPRAKPTTLSVPIRAVIDRVLASHGTTVAALASKGPGSRVGHWASRARDEAVFVARLLEPGASYPALGRLFGRDHSSILVGQRAFAKRMKDNEVLALRMRRLVETARGVDVGEQAAAGGAA